MKIGCGFLYKFFILKLLFCDIIFASDLHNQLFHCLECYRFNNIFVFNILGLDTDDHQKPSVVVAGTDQQEEQDAGNEGPQEHSDGEAGVNDEYAAVDFANLTGRKKKLFELRMKMVLP